MIIEDISIRSIQHWLYCPHRWGLLEIDCSWAENYYVTKSNIIHKKVHETGGYTAKSKKVYTAVAIYNDLPEYGLYGVTDCLEVSGNKFVLVEYKPTKPKNSEYNYDDLMQVFAQKICTDYVFGCNCEGYIYYSDVKKRIRLPLMENFDEYNSKLIEILSEIHKYIRKGTIPPIDKRQKCNGCSMKDLCMPKLKRAHNLSISINELLENKI